MLHKNNFVSRFITIIIPKIQKKYGMNLYFRIFQLTKYVLVINMY